MKIFLLGATGFIGRHVAACLLSEGHTIVAAVRDTASAKRRFPGSEAVRIDMNTMTAASDWLPLLTGIDAVVNCAGILQSGAGQSAKAIHTQAPVALFDACETLSIARVVHISAISADAEAGTEYALTKKAADDNLCARALPWVLLRPSLVYGAGSYGGSSAIRGLAGFPFFTPVVGQGGQLFQPIHVNDLARTVLLSLTRDDLVRKVLEPCGPETLSLLQITKKTRSWLDLPDVPVLEVPEKLVRLAARVGDYVGSGPLRTTALEQMTYGNTGNSEKFEKIIGFKPVLMGEAFQKSPSCVQDRWHARLVFVRPLITLALIALWVFSGLSGLINPPRDETHIVTFFGFPASWARSLGCLFSEFDLLIAVGLILGRYNRFLAWFQVAVVVVYTIGIGFADPWLWINPYGALVKNIPVLLIMVTWAALLDEK